MNGILVSGRFTAGRRSSFVAAVIFNTIMLVIGRQATWVGLTALFPLILLMITGLYMFALPYLAKGRAVSPARDAA